MKRAAAIALLVACGPLDEPPPSPAPVNTCSASACASYAPYDPGDQATCNAGISWH